jgi:hypothetical protein
MVLALMLLLSCKEQKTEKQTPIIKLEEPKLALQRPDSIPFRRGHPLDLRIRPSNYIQLDWKATIRNKINIWLPEVVLYGEDNKFLLMILREEVDYKFSLTKEGGTRHTFEKPGYLTLHALAQPIKDGIKMELTIKNLSSELLKNVRCNVCTKFGEAPDFRNPDLDRTFYVSKGQITYMNRDFTGHLDEFAMTVRDGYPKFGPQKLPALYDKADYGFIGVQSSDKKHTLATWWQDSESVWGNLHPSTMCIHADPVYGDLKPGETKTRKGKMYLMPGTPQDALNRYLAEKNK